MAAAIPPPIYTVEDAMVLCGVPADPIFDGKTPTRRVAEQIFLDSFETCLSTTMDDVKDAITSFSKLTVANGKIPFQPGVKKRITAFVQWTRTELRCGRDPSQTAFPPAELVTLLQDLKECDTFARQADLLASQAKPKQLTPTLQWLDWEATFTNYLRLIPGITGVSLSYVIRRSPNPDPTILTPIHDHYVANAR